MANGNMNNVIIRSDMNITEEDAIGMLLSKYVKGTSYNQETKEWIVPNEIYESLVKEIEAQKAEQEQEGSERDE